MSQELHDIAHWFLLYNSPELEKYLEEHKSMLPIRAGENITHKQRKEFPKWFKDRMNRLRVEESTEATDELWSLANGPNLLVKEYSGCIINGLWQVVQQVQHRGVFYVPEVDNEEPGYPMECDDTFQQESITSVAPINVEAEVHCHRDGVEDEVMLGVGPLDETIEESGDDEDDEDDEIPDVEIDPDMDYDM
ncbi:hypothetical protein RHMOL_Rhmol05G0160200 [Rhododendron molle]|uniref:Uncharacterized protein n=1 Tax=Rhododendron molle TaxID=49168 RepID=A0ACC0NPS2_RHOML|nr:hypothetical protein RHMOL_Rhmol05G0160200 [Rhododendron molle]